MNDLGTHTTPRDSRTLIRVSIAALIAVVIGAGVWTYATRDWNASGTQKAGSPYSSAPSEGGKPLILNK
jgi:hypothetical protein